MRNKRAREYREGSPAAPLGPLCGCGRREFGRRLSGSVCICAGLVVQVRTEDREVAISPGSLQSVFGTLEPLD